MTRARHQQVSLDDTPYYHCITRCVRRAFLCGDDPFTGENFDHRKVWLVERAKQLSSIFSIDICAYAVMSNHYHLVLHVDGKQASDWSQDEVIRRWTRLFSRNAAALETVASNHSSKAAREYRRNLIEQWRERLADISWFMRCLNESIARRANREDDCTGRFWEGRFKSQALLDEKALVTCMAYVDLNPARAGLSETPEGSDFTSIQERLVNHARRVKQRSRQQKSLLRHYGEYFEQQRRLKTSGARLMSFDTGGSSVAEHSLPIRQQDYFDLVAWSASRLPGKAAETGFATRQAADQVLERLGIKPSAWLDTMNYFHKYFYQAAGDPGSLQHFQERRARSNVVRFRNRWIRGIRPATRLYGT
ncbi:MAG: transposase [Gammaproteobacteria bacterium]|jgi:REP element-mobilizing transposase RayT